MQVYSKFENTIKK